MTMVFSEQCQTVAWSLRKPYIRASADYGRGLSSPDGLVKVAIWPMEFKKTISRIFVNTRQCLFYKHDKKLTP
jgi:hypothetical protein